MVEVDSLRSFGAYIHPDQFNTVQALSDVKEVKTQVKQSLWMLGVDPSIWWGPRVAGSLAEEILRQRGHVLGFSIVCCLHDSPGVVYGAGSVVEQQSRLLWVGCG